MPLKSCSENCRNKRTKLQWNTRANLHWWPVCRRTVVRCSVRLLVRGCVVRLVILGRLPVGGSVLLRHMVLLGLTETIAASIGATLRWGPRVRKPAAKLRWRLLSSSSIWVVDHFGHLRIRVKVRKKKLKARVASPLFKLCQTYENVQMSCRTAHKRGSEDYLKIGVRKQPYI